MIRAIFFLFFIFSTLQVKCQHDNFFLGNDYFFNIEKKILTNDINHHISFKPLVKSDFNIDYPNVLFSDINQTQKKSWLYRKLFLEHLFVYNEENYNIYCSPIFDLTLGREKLNQQKIYTNTRGYIVYGNIGQKISFFSSFRENQSVFQSYLRNFINEKNVVPGQGFARRFKDVGFDYAIASGYVSIRPSDLFVIQFGHGKHFVGDGYRSLLLSDNSFNYPFLRVQTSLGKLHYTNLFAELQDISYFATNSIENVDQMGYPKKYMSSHYLSLNLFENLNLSFFESIIWRVNHAPGNRGFDVNYLNPIIFLRPIEFSLNSPDNVLIGLNANYKINYKSYAYSQLILDEFSLNDLRKNNDFWANKYGYQLGFKSYDILNLDMTSFQIEYNYVRPYTYAHHNPQQNYGHYNQSLAHPLGANFSELVSIVRYKYKRLGFQLKHIIAKYGSSFSNNTVSYGNDIFMSTGDYAETQGLQNIGSGRPSDFGIEMYQGNLSRLNYTQLNFSYLINPHTNLKFVLSLGKRTLKDEESENISDYFTFGFKSDLFNNYYDF